jgi:pyridoxine/pyridoxamine 5'-phosphate oxidase
MTVSTIGVDGFRSRVVLLKQYNEEGFIFTQIIIQKGKAIESNPRFVFFLKLWSAKSLLKVLHKRLFSSVSDTALIQGQMVVN